MSDRYVISGLSEILCSCGFQPTLTFFCSPVESVLAFVQSPLFSNYPLTMLTVDRSVSCFWPIKDNFFPCFIFFFFVENLVMRGTRGLLNCLVRAIVYIMHFNFTETCSFGNFILAQLASVENLWQNGYCTSSYNGSWVLKKWRYSMSVTKFFSITPILIGLSPMIFSLF